MRDERRTRATGWRAGLAAVVVATATLGGSNMASAVGFNIFDEPGGALLGVFDAPAAGGTITSLTANIDGVTYDTLAGGVNTPTYYVGTNDIGGSGSSMGYATNSAAAGVCGAGECAFTFYRIFGGDPGEWYTDRIFVPPAEQESLDLGRYKIAPVPGPLGGMLLMSTLGLLAAVRRSKRSVAG